MTSALHAAGLFKAVDVRDVRMIQRGEDLRFALETEPADLRQLAKESGSTLMRDVALQLRVMRPTHLAHAAFANQGGDFIGAEAAAGADGHLRRILPAVRAHLRKVRAIGLTLPTMDFGAGLPGGGAGRRTEPITSLGGAHALGVNGNPRKKFPKPRLNAQGARHRGRRRRLPRPRPRRGAWKDQKHRDEQGGLPMILISAACPHILKS